MLTHVEWQRRMSKQSRKQQAVNAINARWNKQKGSD